MRYILTVLLFLLAAPAMANATPPDTTLTSQQATGTSSSAYYAFTSDQPGSTFKCAYDSPTFGTCPGNGLGPVSYPNQSLGTHTFKVYAVNTAGEADPTPAVSTWTRRGPEPDTIITSAPTDGTQDGAYYAFKSTVPNVTFKCAYDSPNFGTCPGNGLGPVWFPNQQLGTHTFKVYAVDAQGQADPTPAVSTWTRTAEPPPPPPPGSTTDEALNAPLSIEDIFRPRGAANPDIWKGPVSAIQPNVDPNSAALSRAFEQQLGMDPDTGKSDDTRTYLRGNIGYFIYTVNATTKYKTACSYFVLRGTDWDWNRSVHERTVTEGVPVPTGTLQYDGGGDHSMAIYQPSTGYYAEFFDGLTPAPAGTKDPQGRTCDYTYGGAAVTNLKDSPGYFRNVGVFAGAPERNEQMIWGRQASGAMPIIGGIITSEEWNNPSDTDGFGHALAYNVPWASCAAPRWPAVRNDCGGGPLVEGTLFRFAPDADCTKYDAAIANPATSDQDRMFYRRGKAFCTTGKKYGFRVTDQTGVGGAYHVAWGHGSWKPDGGSLGGNIRYPFEYMRLFDSVWAQKIQVMAETPHPQTWAPGCAC